MLHVSIRGQSLDAGNKRGFVRRLDASRAGSVTVTYTAKDFTHWDAPALGTLNIDTLEKTDLYAAVTDCYKT